MRAAIGYYGLMNPPDEHALRDAVSIVSATRLEIVGRCLAIIQPHVGGALGLSLVPSGIARASDAALAQALAADNDIDEGPVTDIVDGALAVWSPDLAAADQWQRWAPRAAALGWRTWLSVQVLGRGEDLIGVLTQAYSEPDAEIAEELADWAAQLGAILSEQPKQP